MQPELFWYLPTLAGLLCDHCGTAPATRLVPEFPSWICSSPACLAAQEHLLIEREREFIRVLHLHWDPI